MKATVENFKQLIDNITENDAKLLAEHSIENHHADGLFYLCLKRSPEETFKLYYVPEVVNPNSGYLVNPHNHRYNFDSVVLSGFLTHFRFTTRHLNVSNASKYSWNWETKELDFVDTMLLLPIAIEQHKKGSRYYVNTSEVHTLKINEPTLIGLIQETDTRFDTNVFIPDMDRSFVAPKSKQMSVETYLNCLSKIKELI